MATPLTSYMSKPLLVSSILSGCCILFGFGKTIISMGSANQVQSPDMFQTNPSKYLRNVFSTAGTM